MALKISDEAKVQMPMKTVSKLPLVIKLPVVISSACAIVNRNKNAISHLTLILKKLFSSLPCIFQR